MWYDGIIMIDWFKLRAKREERERQREQELHRQRMIEVAKQAHAAALTKMCERFAKHIDDARMSGNPHIAGLAEIAEWCMSELIIGWRGVFR